jgi:hypothetical protein
MLRLFFLFPPSIQRWDRGSLTITIITLILLVDFFNVSFYESRNYTFHYLNVKYNS